MVLPYASDDDTDLGAKSLEMVVGSRKSKSFSIHQSLFVYSFDARTGSIPLLFNFYAELLIHFSPCLTCLSLKNSFISRLKEVVLVQPLCRNSSEHTG